MAMLGGIRHYISGEIMRALAIKSSSGLYSINRGAIAPRQPEIMSDGLAAIDLPLAKSSILLVKARHAGGMVWCPMTVAGRKWRRAARRPSRMPSIEIVMKCACGMHDAYERSERFREVTITLKLGIGVVGECQGK